MLRVRDISSWVCLFSLIISSIGFANATAVAVWNKKPIDVELPIGKERIISFSDNVRLGVSKSLQSKIKVTNVAGSIYITALQKFPKSRLQVVFTSTGETALLDIYSINVDGEYEPEDLKIITAKEQEITVDQKVEQLKASSKVSIKELVQFASQDWFAPTRLKPHNNLIQEREVSKPVNLDLLFMGSSAGLFDLKPLKEYSAGVYYLTAIGLRNRTAWGQQIKYSDIDPYVTTISSQHTFVGPRGEQNDTTILYVVTEGPLAISKVAYYE